ncbi:MAG: hypothetical protein R3A52_18465 [Polyangiales bacterium]
MEPEALYAPSASDEGPFIDLDAAPEPSPEEPGAVEIEPDFDLDDLAPPAPEPAPEPALPPALSAEPAPAVAAAP